MNTKTRYEESEDPKKPATKTTPEPRVEEVNVDTSKEPYPTGSPPDPEPYHKANFPDRYPDEEPPVADEAKVKKGK